MGVIGARAGRRLRLHAQSVGGVWAGEVSIHRQHFRQKTCILGVDRQEIDLGPVVNKERQRVVTTFVRVHGD